MTQFKVGDKIKLKERGEYARQIPATQGNDGKITGLDEDMSGRITSYAVRFASGYRNHYRAEHIEHQEEQRVATDKVSMDYKPGTSVLNHVKKLIKEVVSPERRKWLQTFENCVLPPDVREAIDEAITTILCKHKFDEWGINEHFEKGLTNSILLYGKPGTGKTMISESISAVLNKNLMKISSGDIQSNVPGQTERNIVESFKKARKENAVLLLDECDSILSDRNAVGSIIASEINALLQEIERFDGTVILTTNRLHTLDPALQRRIISKVELDTPNFEARKQIWKKLIPKKLPTEKGMDTDILAEADLTGGEIKNAILVSVKKAIAKGENKVKMIHFISAVKGIVKAKKDYEDTRPKRISSNPSQDYVKTQVLDKLMGA